MSDSQPPQPPTDEFIEQLYAEATQHEQPPAELDQLVLTAAAASTPQATWFKRRRWATGLASAAVLALTVGVLLNQPNVENVRVADTPVEHRQMTAEPTADTAASDAATSRPERTETVVRPAPLATSPPSAGPQPGFAEHKAIPPASPTAPEVNITRVKPEVKTPSLAPPPKPQGVISKRQQRERVQAEDAEELGIIEEIVVTGNQRAAPISEQRCRPFERFGSYQVCRDIPNLQVRHNRCKGTYIFDDVDSAQPSRQGVRFRTENKEVWLRCSAREWKLRETTEAED